MFLCVKENKTQKMSNALVVQVCPFQSSNLFYISKVNDMHIELVALFIINSVYLMHSTLTWCLLYGKHYVVKETKNKPLPSKILL